MITSDIFFNDWTCLTGWAITLYLTRKWLKRREMASAPPTSEEIKAESDAKAKIDERYWVFKSFLFHCKVTRNFEHNFFAQRNLQNTLVNEKIFMNYCITTEPNDLVKNAFNFDETNEGRDIWNALSDYWVSCDKETHLTGTVRDNIGCNFKVKYYAY